MKKAMKKTFLTAMAAVLALSGAGCGEQDNSSESQSDSTPKEITVQAGYTRYDLKDSTRKTEGFGTQFDTLIVEKQNGGKAEDWQVHVDALETMNLQNVRIRFFPEMYERGNDNDDPNVFDYDSPDVDFNSLEMQHLYSLLDAFEKNGVKVDLSWYGCRTTFASEDGKINGSWLGGNYGDEGVNSWSVLPRLGNRPYEEFAESVAACLNYLLNEKKYTCIYEYSLFPEPDGMMSSMEPYKEVSELTKKQLEKYGIKDKILFSGPADYGNNSEKFEERFLSQIDVEKATSSVYCYNADSFNEVMLDFAQGYTAVCDKYGISWGIAESGTNHGLTPVTNSDSDTYDRALFMARFAINMVNGGCTNIKYFVFGDCWYDGALNELGLFKFKHEGWKAKPVWYSWSLICRFTDFGSEIYPVTDSYGDDADTDVCITAFKLPDGSWTYLAANNGTSAKKVAIVNDRTGRPEKMKLYRMTEATLPVERTLSILPVHSEIDASQGAAHFAIPAKGFVVLSDKK